MCFRYLLGGRGQHVFQLFFGQLSTKHWVPKLHRVPSRFSVERYRCIVIVELRHLPCRHLFGLWSSDLLQLRGGLVSTWDRRNGLLDLSP